ncbi:MAG: mannose-1-phosphate guanylyltransferase/mannose-6-phosphate isomerase [Alphaproteobacteria bacterium]|nr:mannose-1-phosphate guanylyltransferase/mannose-6-phosphate isomerase [Alphaproteobacteria bacterium]
MVNKKIIPVVLCGGSGTRLWPISRENMPKQFLNLTGHGSLLQNTVLRAVDIAKAAPSDLVTVTLEPLRKEVTRQLNELNPELTQHILGEPAARNTAAAIMLAARYVLDKFGPETLMWVLPSDHHIGDEKALAQAVNDALHAVQEGFLVTFGIKPTRAETGYGYVRVGDALEGQNSVRRAAQFVEKPSADVAQAYIESGEYLWNSGMFLFNTDTILMNFRRLATDIYDTVHQAIKTSIVSPSAEIYSTVAEQPFDKAIMEKADKVAVIPCNPAWSDIGGWESLWEISKKDENGNVVEGKAALYDSKNCIVHAQERLVACAGLENIVVAETGDSVLVADKRNGDAMKFLVKALKASGQKEVREPSKETRPWGMFKVLSESSNYKIKEIVVTPDQKLSLQSHNHRAEFWIVLEGEAIVTVDSEEKHLKEQETVFIPLGATHRLANPGKKNLTIIEVQCGDYLGEDDIVRYDDIYGRAAA